MGILSRLGGMMGGGGRGAMGGGDNAMMGNAMPTPPMGGGGMAQAMPPTAAPPAMSAQGQALVQRLQQRAMELQEQQFLPPRLRNELNEITDLIRRIESGEQALG